MSREICIVAYPKYYGVLKYQFNPKQINAVVDFVHSKIQSACYDENNNWTGIINNTKLDAIIFSIDDFNTFCKNNIFARHIEMTDDKLQWLVENIIEWNKIRDESFLIGNQILKNEYKPFCVLELCSSFIDPISNYFNNEEDINISDLYAEIDIRVLNTFKKVLRKVLIYGNKFVSEALFPLSYFNDFDKYNSEYYASIMTIFEELCKGMTLFEKQNLYEYQPYIYIDC